MGLIKNFCLRIPKEKKDDFFLETSRDNYHRMILCSIIILIVEIIVFARNESKHNLCTINIILSIILFNACMLPLLLLTMKKWKQMKTYLIKLVLLAYLMVSLFLSCFMSLMTQINFATIDVYLIAIFAISAFVSLPPVESFLLFASVYLVFFLLLPGYQDNDYAILVLRTNAFFMNFIAWLLSYVLYQSRIKSFLDHRLIEEKNRQLKETSIRDTMTSLLNHGYIYKTLEEEMAKARCQNTRLCILMLDVDDFKEVNDQYGHLVGDTVLVELSKILIQTCRTTDFIGRYGGEEFMVILPNTGLLEAKSLGERIRENIQQKIFENKIGITASMGINEYIGNESTEELIRGADKKLYRAKSLGKNRVIVRMDE